MKAVVVFVIVTLLVGCSVPESNADRISALQKQVDALSAKVGKIEATKAALTDFDLQEKCATAAKRRFDSLMATGDQTGVDLHDLEYEGFVSNYNATLGRCFIAYSLTGKSPDPNNGIGLEDAISGVRYGYYFQDGKTMVTCFVTERGEPKHCASMLQFREYLKTYMGAADLSLPNAFPFGDWSGP